MPKGKKKKSPLMDYLPRYPGGYLGRCMTYLNNVERLGKLIEFFIQLSGLIGMKCEGLVHLAIACHVTVTCFVFLGIDDWEKRDSLDIKLPSCRKGD